MGAMVGPNIGLSELGSRMVRALTDEDDDTDYVVNSTEELLFKFEEYNKNRKEKVLMKRMLLLVLWILINGMEVLLQKRMELS